MMRFLVTMVVLFSSPAFADGFRSLKELQNVATNYPLVRCGALYQAIMERSGKERMGAETWAASDQSRSNLLLLGALILSSEITEAKMDEIGTIVKNDARNIADIYVERMNGNFANSGQAFGADALMVSDLEQCKALASVASQQVQSLGLN